MVQAQQVGSLLGPQLPSSSRLICSRLRFEDHSSSGGASSVARAAPALLGSLTGDAKPGADFGPGIACVAEAVDGLLGSVVDVVDQGDDVS